MTIKQRAFEALDANPTLSVTELSELTDCAWRTAESYRLLWRKGASYRRDHPDEDTGPQVAEITEYPVLTAVGVCWCPPVEVPHRYKRFGAVPCDVCVKLGDCRQYVRQGDLACCERVLVEELL